ncbi:hypothetical protein CORC01_00287 [Colletotrichum orchidophilum]|uniref:Uncharacterized protein n=1 Tax=Colletotrichum orchidophilum TaxID=1209926 RepID=A0A1G4BSV6_9PEZI|nr:uncharacterized protein CORC01_00287 [Colletotrichum orchidophilum]OHF04435.1 hypothetical protein CORC01_00287 [Colletotrichum orchidophilum]
MSSSHAHYQRNGADPQSVRCYSYTQEKRGRDVSNEEDELVYGLTKRARTVGQVHHMAIDADQALVKLSHELYTVGWVCALPLEMAAAQAMLDYVHQPLDMNPNDSNVYMFGSIGLHNIVIACLPSGQYGTTSAAVVANNMRWSFPSIHIGLMVGIGGGVPGKVDIRLGDVVVSNPTADSPGVVQYDFGKAVNDGHFERIGNLNKPPPSVLAAVSRLRADHEAWPSQIPTILSHMEMRNPYMIGYSHRNVEEDRLFEASYEHSGETCDSCDRSKLVSRDPRPTDTPSIHYGIIASGNQVMKHAKTRDRLAKDLGLLCFEMEAAGLMDNFPCLVIRGICDYSDSHKAKRWQKYAAATAAAYAKELLLITPVQGNSTTQKQPEVCDIETPPSDRQRLLDSLKFNQIDKRHANIKANHAKTCEWLIDHPDYIAWIDRKKYSRHHGFLWIRGKPGAGKSTIMKFAFTRARRRTSSMGTSISFFFNARGEGLEKTTLGMYRSLLHQLFEKMPDLQVLLDANDVSPLDQQGLVAWDLETTKTLFRSTIRKLGQRQLTCFIDALDECAEGEVREMVEVFEDLGQYAVQKDLRFYVCLSSRHYPYIDIQYGQKLILEDQIGHGEDIANYARSSLKAGTGSKSDEVIAEILRKASGVFMWVVLVVDILNKEYNGGRVFKIKSRLKEIPSKLSELFQNMLTRDQENLDDLLLCIQWVLYGARPLKREEYYFALASGLEPDTLGEWDPNEIPHEFMDRLIVSSSKGLAETTRSDDKTVQFIHESVRDFLLKDNGLRNLWPELGADFEAQSHNRLRDCCHVYSSQVNISEHLPENEFLLDSSKEQAAEIKDQVEQGFPFLEYANSHVLYHADAAAQTAPQIEFFQTFPLDQWIQRSNLFEKHKTRRHQPSSTSLLYIVAEKGLANLVGTALRQTSDAEIRGGRYGFPLLAALKEGHEKAASLLLQCTASSATQDRSTSYNTPGSDTSTQVPPSIDCMDKEGHIARLLIETGVCVNTGYEDNVTPLLVAALNLQKSFIEFLLDNGADINGRDSRGRTPLHKACTERGGSAAINLLLEKGAHAHAQDIDGNTPLFVAVLRGNESAVVTLLRHSSVKVQKDDDGITFSNEGLQQAVGNGLLEHRHLVNKQGQTPLFVTKPDMSDHVLGELLDADLDPAHQDDAGQNFLHEACKREHATSEYLECVEKAIQKGLEIDGRDYKSRTPLMNAANKMSRSFVDFLLQHGANPNARDDEGHTPLSEVVSSTMWIYSPRDLPVVRSLLDAGADVTESGPDGENLVAMAIRLGKNDVAELLRARIEKVGITT